MIAATPEPVDPADPPGLRYRQGGCGSQGVCRGYRRRPHDPRRRPHRAAREPAALRRRPGSGEGRVRERDAPGLSDGARRHALLEQGRQPLSSASSSRGSLTSRSATRSAARRFLAAPTTRRSRRNRSYFGDFDPFGDFDLLLGAAKANLKIVEVPVRYEARRYGDTKISRFRHGALLLKMSWFAFWRLKLR